MLSGFTIQSKEIPLFESHIMSESLDQMNIWEFPSFF